MQTCLLVIDAQQSFAHRPYFDAQRATRYLEAQNALIRGCAAAGVPLLRVLHSDGPEREVNPFARCSGHVRAIDGLADFEDAAQFVKSRHSALVGTGLDVWLVRHGETEWSRAGRHTGCRSDPHLTDRGRAQAEALGTLLSEVAPSPSLVLTSTLARAAETCRLAGLGDRAEPTADLVEWDYGAYEGLTTAEIRADRPGWTLWTDGVPGGESAADVGRRADRVVERARSVSGDVVMVAHAHLLRVLAARWVGLPPAGGRLLRLDVATLSGLGWEREVPVVSRWNQPAAPGPPPRPG